MRRFLVRSILRSSRRRDPSVSSARTLVSDSPNHRKNNLRFRPRPGLGSSPRPFFPFCPSNRLSRLRRCALLRKTRRRKRRGFSRQYLCHRLDPSSSASPLPPLSSSLCSATKVFSSRGSSPSAPKEQTSAKSVARPCHQTGGRERCSLTDRLRQDY